MYRYSIANPGKGIVLRSRLCGSTFVPSRFGWQRCAGDETFVKSRTSSSVHSAQVPCLGPSNTASSNQLCGFETGSLLVADLSNKALDVIQASTHSFLFYVTKHRERNKPSDLLDSTRRLRSCTRWPRRRRYRKPYGGLGRTGNSTVKVIDLVSRQITELFQQVYTRADELAYDPAITSC